MLRELYVFVHWPFYDISICKLYVFKILQFKNARNVQIQIILLTKFDSNLIHFNTKVYNTRLILPFANLLCCAWVRKRIQ